MYAHRNKFIFLISISLLFLTNCNYINFETQISKNQEIKDWFLNTKYGKLEASITWPSHDRSVPCLLMIHSSHGNNQKNKKELLSLTGYPIIAMSISLPGFGSSTGPQDFGGRRSVESINQSIFYLSRINTAKNKCIFLYAKGFGANAAIIAATQNPDIQLLIIENGIFQHKKILKRIPRNIRIRLNNFLLERDYKTNFRSSLQEIEKIQIPIFIIKNIRGKGYELEQFNKLIHILKLNNKRYKIMKIKEKKEKLIFKKIVIKKRIIPIIEKHIKKEIKFN